MLEDPLLCSGGSAFLMTCLRSPFLEETVLLAVLQFPFRVRTQGWGAARAAAIVAGFCGRQNMRPAGL